MCILGIYLISQKVNKFQVQNGSRFLIVGFSGLIYNLPDNPTEQFRLSNTSQNVVKYSVWVVYKLSEELTRESAREKAKRFFNFLVPTLCKVLLHTGRLKKSCL